MLRHFGVVTLHFGVVTFTYAQNYVHIGFRASNKLLYFRLALKNSLSSLLMVEETGIPWENHRPVIAIFACIYYYITTMYFELNIFPQFEVSVWSLFLIHYFAFVLLTRDHSGGNSEMKKKYRSLRIYGSASDNINNVTKYVHE
jgi:hypothetical protein